VNEYTSASGVTVDGVLLKDAEVTASGTNGVITNVIKALAASGVKFQENGGTEIGSYGDAGGWTLGASGTTATATHTSNGVFALANKQTNADYTMPTDASVNEDTTRTPFLFQSVYGTLGGTATKGRVFLAGACYGTNYVAIGTGATAGFDGLVFGTSSTADLKKGLITNNLGSMSNAGLWRIGAAGGTLTHLVNGSASLSGSLIMQRTELTASATGTATITVTGSYHTVTGASGAASTVTTINGGVTGSHLVLRATSDTVDITLATGGNLALAGGASFTLDSYLDTISFVYDATLSKWLELYRSSNS
jgi:hypothetical protein